MYIYPYIHVYTYTYVYMAVYMYICIYVCIYIFIVCLCVCVFHSDTEVRLDHMGWLRLVGSMNSWVSFAEYHLFNGALLQKRPIILSILLTEATP